MKFPFFRKLPQAAVHGLTMAAAKDLAPHAIRVNTVMPALIGPENGYMWARQNSLHAASGSPYFKTDPEQVNSV
jgi:NAD(P)-dependent dehydrogenase (short-subunit alcohol dehydrogenase family)